MIVYNGNQDVEVYKNVYGRVMAELCAEDKDVICLDADLMNSIGMLGLMKKQPAQAINVGIAEANMVGIAAGLSAGGKKPYVHTFGPFASRRCYDQSFLSVAYAGNSVRILGSDPGVTAAFNGGTHMPFEDIALMRAIPTATVIEISDGAMFESVLRQIKDRPGLTYLRCTRKSYPALYSKDHPFHIGKGEVVRDGADITVFAIGLMVGEAMKAAEALANEGVQMRVVDLFTIKPLDTELVLRCAAETGAVLTSENHNIMGGLGDAVAAVLLENGCHVPFKKHGVEDRFGSVGPQDFLQKEYSLTAASLQAEAKKLLAKKQ